MNASRKPETSPRTIAAACCLLAVLAGCEKDPVSRTAAPYRPYTTETRLLEAKQDICIVTQYTSNMDGYARIAVDNHQDYAFQHGYKAFSYRGRISGARFTDPANPERLRRDGLYWQKIAAVQLLLDRREADGSAACRWVMWLDGDAIFTNYPRTVESVLAPYADKDVVLSREHFDTLINAGVFFVKNTPKGRAFLEGVAAMYPAYKDYELPEQQAMQDYAFGKEVPPPRTGLFEALLPRLRPEIGIAPQRTFDSFAEGGHSDPLYAWAPCDFVAHLAQVKTETRATRMAEMTAEAPHCAP
jgi:hypothetical protein